MSEIKFRKATLDDLHFLFKLRRDTMDEHLHAVGLFYTDADHRERIFDHFEESLIIYVNNIKIGLLKLGKLKDRYHIRQLQIIPEHQNRGYGTKVMEQLLIMALKTNKDVTLNVLKKNPALHLYQRAGFKVIGENEIEFQMRCNIC